MLKNKKLGVYPGSFDPYHRGHLDVTLKAKELFDEVAVAVGVNPRKTTSKIDKVETIKKQIPGIQVEEFKGLLTDYISKKEHDGYDVTIIRGIRNGQDLDNEIIQLRVMRDFKPDVKMVFFPCEVTNQYVSSSMIKDLESIQKGSGSEYLAKSPLLEWRNEINVDKLLAQVQVIIARPGAHGYGGSAVINFSATLSLYKKEEDANGAEALERLKELYNILHDREKESVKLLEFTPRIPMSERYEFKADAYDKDAIIKRAKCIVEQPHANGYSNEMVFGTEGMRDCLEKVVNKFEYADVYFARLIRFLHNEDVVKKTQ